MPFMDLPPQLQERIVCSISAAAKYAIPANVVLAVAEKEGGKPGQWVRNSNGTHDVGPMQFNTAYLKSLARYGITANDVAKAGCYPFDLAAWRLRQHIKNDTGDLWKRVSNYHSRTHIYNATYRADLMVKAIKWADWLQARFVTYDVTKPGAPALLPSVPRVGAAVTASVKPSAKIASWKASEYVPRKLLFEERP
ncbi:MAG: transglycosylase SLT domain-containing protein [Phyllobacteriaceae bacterium]|nr:transglycosylase SLT domain-containing protein [Phyllobacteriaceae bacterium]